MEPVRRRKSQLILEFTQEYARAGFHGGGPCFYALFQKFPDGAAEIHIPCSKVRQTLERKGSDNGAAILQVALQSRGRSYSFSGGKRQPRDHLCQVPSKFDLMRFAEQSQQFGFVGAQQARFRNGDFFCRIGRPHPDNRIIVPQTLEEFRKAPRLAENKLHHFV